MKVGLIGIGGMGFVHFNCYKKMEGVKIAVADIRVDMAKEEIKDDSIPVYASYEEMIEKEELDFVDICTPSYLHADMAVYALEHGLHTLCEKPMRVPLLVPPVKETECTPVSIPIGANLPSASFLV